MAERGFFRRALDWVENVVLEIGEAITGGEPEEEPEEIIYEEPYSQPAIPTTPYQPEPDYYVVESDEPLFTPNQAYEDMRMQYGIKYDEYASGLLYNGWFNPNIEHADRDGYRDVFYEYLGVRKWEFNWDARRDAMYPRVGV
jgi:hypothetical protein